MAADQQQPMPVASGAGSRRRRGARTGAGRKIWCRSGPGGRHGEEGIQRWNVSAWACITPCSPPNLGWLS
eukprot:1158083-Pelagomonas_calceolata.AAC.4